MKRGMVVSILIAFILVTLIIYLLLPGRDSWCPTQVGDKEIHGGVRRVCLYESTYDSGEVRVRSWETRNREYLYQEFYKRGAPQYSITYWNEDGKRCREIKRIANRFVPEGVECVKI